jgi:predicted nucleic-acid-binding protein
MIGLDTNILVRYLVQDDAIRALKARKLIEHQLTEENPGFISVAAMLETVWILGSGYGLTGRDIVEAVERLLQIDVLFLQNEQEVFTAMMSLKTGRSSFPDALIAALGAKFGCRYTVTFDRKALRVPGFERL